MSDHEIYQEGVISGLIYKLDILRRQLEQKDGVIAALQQNIAELTRLPVVNVRPKKTVISNVTMTVYPDEADTKPAIPAAALTPAKLPRFF